MTDTKTKAAGKQSAAKATIKKTSKSAGKAASKKSSNASPADKDPGDKDPGDKDKVETAPKAPATESKDAQKNPDAGKIDINFSRGLAPFLAANDFSLAFTSYQTGRLYLVGSGAENKLALHEAIYPQAMGVCGNAERVYLGTLTQVVRMENVLGHGQVANEAHDKVYVPRNMQTTGNIDIHELAIRDDGRIIFVNTSHSCLCEPSLKHSFKPIWKPDFISKLAPEDRCHLNGLAMENGQPKYVSAICRSDVVDGWRDRRDDGGIIIDIETNEIVAENLSMPHSPRVHDGKLWILNSGTGELGWIDKKKKSFNPVAFFPGFLRGLAFHNGHAIVTLSKPRYKRFDGLALADTLKEKDADAWCGVQIISLNNGNVAQWIRFDGGISELFDVCTLPGVKNPITLGPQSAEIRDFITIEQPDW